jgi:2-polyprenyl-6-methoxyphenol hydroxylase-like FAD-dependent oxidoreductase
VRYQRHRRVATRIAVITPARDVFDLVIIGGGIAGNALAAVMARAGKAVLVLERSTVYRDRVRGEGFHAWGVAEARRLGLQETLLGAGGAYHRRLVPYDETVTPSEAVAASIALDRVLADVPGTLGVGHPQACEALSVAAAASGARILRGVEKATAEAGRVPVVRYSLDGGAHSARCRLVVGADGRESVVRRQAGMALHATQPRLLMAGMLVDDLKGWPEEHISIGTEGDRVFFIVPQAAGRARLYLLWSCDQPRRFAGPAGPRAFLDSFRLTCIPESDGIVQSRPAGPCATYPMHDTWTDSPIADGLALIGDAAGYSDPHIGQGLSVALRDVRILSELLIATEDWSAAALRPYAEERAERLRRLRFCNAMATTLRGEFGDEPRARRRRARALMQAEPELGLWRRATMAGPESVPASAFDKAVYERLCNRPLPAGI